MAKILNIAIGRHDLSAAMSVVAVLIAGGLTKADYFWWGIGVLAGFVMLAGGSDLLRRGLKKKRPCRCGRLRCSASMWTLARR